MTDPNASARAHYQQWLDANPTAEGRGRVQAALDCLPPMPNSDTPTQAPQAAAEAEAAVARQILAAFTSTVSQ